MRQHDVTNPAGSDPENFPSFFEAPPSLEQLAAMQGVGPVRAIESLRANFWPEADSIEEFASTVRAWRNDGA